METKTTGLVLREVNYKESDKILTVLTPEGKLTVKARGARKKESRVAACAQLFAYSELRLSEYRGRTTLTEGETVELFSGLRRDLEAMALGAYFLELAEAVTGEGEDCRDILSLTLNALYALDSLGKPAAVVKPAFELRLMALAGFRPMLDGCAACGKTEPESPRLNVTHGVLHCAACRGELRGGISLPVSAGTLAAMRFVLAAPGKKLFSFSASEETLRELGEVAEAYLHAQLERGFKTLDFYKSLT